MAKIIHIIFFLTHLLASAFIISMEMQPKKRNYPLHTLEQPSQKSQPTNNLTLQGQWNQKATHIFAQEQEEQNKHWHTYRDIAIIHTINIIENRLKYESDLFNYKEIDPQVIEWYKICNPCYDDYYLLKYPTHVLNIANKCIPETVYTKPLCAAVVNKSIPLRMAIARQCRKIRKMSNFDHKVLATNKFLTTIENTNMRKVVKNIIKSDFSNTFFNHVGCYLYDQNTPWVLSPGMNGHPNRGN